MSVEEVGMGRGDIARRIATISDTTFVVGHGHLEQIHKYAVETVTQCRILMKRLQITHKVRRRFRYNNQAERTIFESS